MSRGGAALARKNSNKNNSSERFCKYRLSHDGSKTSLIAECMECDGKAQLTDRKCLAGILSHLSQEYNVDSVILSHYIETKYTEDSMYLLNTMVDFIQHLDQMRIREPYEEYFENDERLSQSFKNQQRSTCESCDLRPEIMFAALRRDFVRGMSGFYREFTLITGKVAANREAACSQCMKATESDLIYLFKKLDSFRAFVFHKGFQIVR